MFFPPVPEELGGSGAATARAPTVEVFAPHVGLLATVQHVGDIKPCETGERRPRR